MIALSGWCCNHTELLCSERVRGDRFDDWVLRVVLLDLRFDLVESTLNSDDVLFLEERDDGVLLVVWLSWWSRDWLRCGDDEIHLYSEASEVALVVFSRFVVVVEGRDLVGNLSRISLRLSRAVFAWSQVCVGWKLGNRIMADIVEVYSFLVRGEGGESRKMWRIYGWCKCRCRCRKWLYYDVF